MAKTLPIVLQPHPILTRVAEPAAGASSAVLTILEDMLNTLYAADGVGLAAPQVSVSQRLVVMDLGVEGKDGKRDYAQKSPIFMINPEVVWKSEEMASRQEGCLSLPGLWADVERPERVKVRFTDRDGAQKEQEVTGLLGVCVQHEIDHLDGIIFPQRMSRLRRDMAMKKWAKLRDDVLENGADFDVLDAHKGLIKARQR